jgi:hypothetical protein
VKEVILVPRREDHGPRDALWEWCRAWWERYQSHMPIFEGHHTDGQFNRSAAVNRAAKLAGDWDVAVIIDSDVICDPQRVKDAVALALETGKMVIPHDIRKDLDHQGTEAVMHGFTGNWDRFVRRRYGVFNGHPSVSSVIVVPRVLWDEIGGFDEWFRGWGYEDTAFAAAAETFGGIIRLEGEVWHFWHPTAAEGKRGTETHSRNSARGQRYRVAIGDKAAIRALQEEGRQPLATGPGIPKILHRTVPERTTPEVERWWDRFGQLHPDWALMTHRDPLIPADWPLTSAKWPVVNSGAQFADLIRLEALLRWGGVYVDSDVEPLQRLDPLLPLMAFAAWEDHRTVPNAVMGAVPNHPAIRECLELALERIPGDTWPAGPGVTTEVLVGRSDVLLLPPGSFYPVHYRDPDRDRKMRDAVTRKENPWAFGIHHYAHSWKAAEKAG